jgi:hypothetical protein
VVDALVGGDGGGRAGEPEREEGPLQGRALGPIEVEQGVIDVEEYGAEMVQGPTWRGR